MKVADIARRFAWEVWLPAAGFILWWILSAESRSFYFPALSDIVAAFRENWLFAQIPTDLWPSLQRLFWGYLIALVAGIAVGLLAAAFRWLGDLLSPTVEFLRALPAVAVVPIMVLLFGLEDEMKIATLAFVGFFPVMLNAFDGARSVESQLHDVASSYHISFSHRVRFILLPAASPQIFAGARVALSLCIMSLAIAEMVGAPGGVGHSVLAAQRAFDIPAMWAAILMFGILGYVLNRMFLALEHVVLAWHRGMTTHQK